MKNNFFNISEKTRNSAKRAEEKCAKQFEYIEKIRQYNSEKVLSAFIKNKVSDVHFNETTGYGYGDIGRETLEKVTAEIFCAEDALIRHNFASGTHALCVALLAVLRPNDVMVCVTGTPYDTLHGVIGINGAGDGQGNFNDYGIKYEQIELIEDKFIDIEKTKKSAEYAKVIYIQRSRGYSLRRTISVKEVGEVAKAVKSVNPQALIVVDNCYCEFCEFDEPCEVGADLIIGSLIKNPGGGIAKTGGYIAGKTELVDLCGYRLTAPGVGREIGCTLGQNRGMFQGLFLAPNVTAEALKTAIFTAALCDEMGFEATPTYDETRSDIIQAIKLITPENLVGFCQGIQAASPVDSFAAPEPWDMPGYDSPVVMAAGAFNMGASIELSADAPLREPFAVWMQGGLTYASAKVAVMLAAQKLGEINAK